MQEPSRNHDIAHVGKKPHAIMVDRDRKPNIRQKKAEPPKRAARLSIPLPFVWSKVRCRHADSDSSQEGNMAKKTTCPITRAQFDAGARPVEITINGVSMQAPVKKFSTGSLGWYVNGKTTIDVGGVSVPVQIGLNLTIVGSKELPQDAPAHPTGGDGTAPA
jgi:hypothetical protein